MKISIRNNKWIHYALLYLALIWNQSVAQQQAPSALDYVITLFLLAFFRFVLKEIEKRTLLFLSFLFIATFILSFTTHGGIGVSHWFKWAPMILAALASVYYDKKKFVERYLNIVCFIAGISIICFAWQMVDRGSLEKFLLIQGELAQNHKAYSYFQGFTFTSIEHYKFSGMFLYVVNGMNLDRNVGLYTEPGVYQIVLNTALFFLLYEKNSLDPIKKRRYILVLVIALVTAQSTTGYIAMVAIVLTYLFGRQRLDGANKTKRVILKIVIIAIVGCVADVIVRGSQSILVNIVIDKLKGAGGELTTEMVKASSSGGARIGTAFLCISSMIVNPWGIGYSAVNRMLDPSVTGFVGAEFLAMGAAMGILPFFVVMFWIFYPIWSGNRINLLTKILWTFLFFNTAIAQSAVFYPALIGVPIYYYATRHDF